MLLHTMTEAEIKKEIERDLRWALNEFETNSAAAFRKVNKLNRKKFPASVTYKRISPKNNTIYLTYVFTVTRTQLFCHIKICFLMTLGNGKHKLLETSIKPDHTPELIAIYASHFFDRYAERLNIKQTGLNAIEHFVYRYYHGTFHSANNKVFESYPFGIGLGNWDGGKIMYINTFVANDMCFDDQIERIEVIKAKHNPSLQMTTIFK